MDIFFFTSPAEQGPQKGQRDIKWRDKPSAKRRKTGYAMDTSPYRAQVVRVVEPTMVANDLSALLTEDFEALLDAEYLPFSLDSLSLFPNGQLTRVSSVHKLGDVPTSHDPALANVAVTTLLSTPDPHSSHPRPESSDLWEEEEGRRIRFALADDNEDHVERLWHSFALRIDHQQTQWWPDSIPAPTGEAQMSPPDIQRSSSEASNNELSPQRSTLEHSTMSPSPPPLQPPLPLHTARQLLWDDNLMAVDDYRRNYDFADFMEEWRLRARHQTTLPAFPSEPGPSPWRKPQHEYIRHSGVRDGQSQDLQGLRWDHFGVGRRSALKARTSLHVQSVSINVSSDLDVSRHSALHYEPRAFAPGHMARFSHYQLRNLTASGSYRETYYAAGNKVKHASLSSTSPGRTVIDLAKPSHSASPFKITCLAASPSGSSQQDDVLIVGGFNGEYATLDLNSTISTRPTEGIVSHAKDGIVNHISIFRGRQTSTLQAAFSSNDHKVRIMDVRRQQFTDRFDYDSAINCSTMSPDGRLRALVHDGPDGWITSAESGEILVKLDAHTDFAFACVWSPCSRYVATGAEDGQVIIWDARNWGRPLHKLECVVSCARSLHFTDHGALVIAEGEDAVSVVDTETFETRQDIRFFGAVAGVSLVNGGEELVVANADTTVGGLIMFSRVARGCGNGGHGVMMGRGRQRRMYESSVVEELLV